VRTVGWWRCTATAGVRIVITAVIVKRLYRRYVRLVRVVLRVWWVRFVVVQVKLLAEVSAREL
jgi:hypothetical protein